MSVRNKYFEMIKSGHKDIELRAYDEKHKKICCKKFCFRNIADSTRPERQGI